MGIFDWLFKKDNVEKARDYDGYFETLTAYRPHFTSWNGKLYEADLVRSAIDARARNISKLKVEIIGTAQPKLQSRLKLRPNPWQTWSQFMYRTSTILDMHNTAVIVPVYNDMMETVGYYTVLPEKCEVVNVDGEPWLRYEFKNRKKAAERLSLCCILTRFQYSSDFFGEPNTALNPTMKLIHLDNQAIEEAVKNGAQFRFFAKLNNFSSAEDLKNERKRFSETNLKTDEGGGLLLFPNTYTDIKELTNKAYTVPEAELREIRTSVYNYFAVNEDILQSKAYGDAWAAFYESVIEPFAIMFSEGMTLAAFTDTEIQHGTQFMATSNRLQYLTTAEKLSVSSQMADRGIMNRDEVREIWNLPPLPDGQGQAYTIRGEYYMIDENGNFTKEGTNTNRSIIQKAEKRQAIVKKTNEGDVIAVDFDGVICRNKYPKIGDPNDELIEDLIKRQKDGAKLILWTCREGTLLEEAKAWCEERGLVFDHINENTDDRVKKYGYDSRKVSADLYIDDKAEALSFK